MMMRPIHVLLAFALVVAGCNNESETPLGGTGGANIAPEGGGGGGAAGSGGTAGGDAAPGGDVAAEAALEAAPHTPIPADLVGGWERSTSITRMGYTFYADGGYVYAMRLATGGSCIVIAAIEITETGVVEIAGDQLRFVPSKETNVETDCAGTKTPKPTKPTPSRYTYRIKPTIVPQLDLTNASGTTTTFGRRK